MYASTSNGILKSIDHGKSWTYSGDVPHLLSLVVHPSQPDTLYAGSLNGIYKTTDAGRTWKAINQGLNVPNNDNLFKKKQKTLAIQSIEIDPKQSNIMISSSIYEEKINYIFLSQDSGDHWRIVYAETNINSIAFDPLQPANVFAGTDKGLLQSKNGGISWQASSPLFNNDKPIGFSNLIVTKTAKQSLFAHGVGSTKAEYEQGIVGLMKSENSGLTWQKIEGACGRLVVASSSPNILYSLCYKGGGMGAGHSDFKKSTDYGKSWEQLGEGLPKSWFAPALAIDPNNSNILFASWANGGLYQSKDGGKSWKILEGI
jgi:photosystem II stability/assembly factor-like uncharacterized protein